MKNEKKIIVYGLGRLFKRARRYLESKFEIVGYSDSENIIMDGKMILPENINNYDYDYICVTSMKYFSEIKDKLISLLGEENENKIIGLYDALGDFRNDEIRERWVIDHIIDIPAGKILLDAGAGEQRYKLYCKHLEYIAQDFGKYVPNEIKTGLQSNSWDYSELNIKCDITQMPLENESIDVVLCTEVFEHIKEPILALKEFARILKEGGRLILTAPFCCLTHMAPYFYYSGFSEFWYKEHWKSYGFEIIEFTRYGDYFKWLLQELFRVEEMAKRYCSYELNEKEIDAIVSCMEVMAGLSDKDMGSNELLCFGNMIVAEKR